MSRRAAFPESELRRWARVAREEGVAIRGTRDSSGKVTVIINPANDQAPDTGNPWDEVLQ